MRQRTGLLVMFGGLVLALVSALLVISISRTANIPAEVPQVMVVMATRDIPELVPVSADALTLRPFPSAFVPSGAIGALDQAVGKFTTTRIVKDQIIVAAQLSPTRRAGNIAASVPRGKVAVAFPGNDILSGTGAIRAGDRVDILVTLNLPRDQQAAPGAPPPTGRDSLFQSTTSLSTQTTMQNVEVLAVGQDLSSSAPSSAPGQVGVQRQTTANQTVITFLVDHQDALVLKFIKDAGGVIDLALRSPNDSQAVQTDAVTLNTIFDQFKFRLAGPLRQ